jgi:hypothetical protein
MRQIFAIVTGLSMLPLLIGSATAAPTGVPQYMVPAYMPASPTRSVASFRPQYRAQQPVRYLPVNATRQGRPPAGYYPVRRAVAWPLPVSYQPIARRMPPPQVYPWMRHRYPTAPGPLPGYQARPMPRMAYGQSYPRRAMPWGGPPPAYAYPGYRGYRPPMPVNYRQPNAWMPPVRSAMRPSVYGYPQQQIVRPAMPRYQPMPARLARYQPYYNHPGAPRNYRFRPAPSAVAYQGSPISAAYPYRPSYPANYNFRPDLRNSNSAINPWGPYAMRAAPGRYPKSFTARQNETLAWSNAPYMGKY